MSPWLCPEVLLVLAGVGLILTDALLPPGKRTVLPGIALLTELRLVGRNNLAIGTTYAVLMGKSFCDGRVIVCL